MIPVFLNNRARGRVAQLAAVALLLSFMAYQGLASAAGGVELVDALVVSEVEGQVPPTDTPKYPVADMEVYLYLVLKARVDGADVIFTEARGAVVNGKPLDPSITRRWPTQEYGDLKIVWSKVEPSDRYVSNTDSGWHWEKVRYAETPFEQDKWKVLADVNPTIMRTRIGRGTMRFKVSVSGTAPIAGQRVASPGVESYGPTGINDDVHRISVRGDTGVPIIDWAYSLMNLPYIWGSESPTGKPQDHQSERYLGADCADYITAAARKAGFNIEYGGSHNLSPEDVRQYTEYVAVNPRLARDGIYREGDSKIVFGGKDGVRPGDLVYFKRRHVGLLLKDRPPLGYLSAEDTMLHALFKEPREDAISKAYPPPFSIVRFKDSLAGKK